jgi:hypothetical protein
MLNLGLVRRGTGAPGRDVLAAALALGVALIACKSQHNVKGSITVNGAPFVAKQCNVGEMTLNMNGNSGTTHSVTLVDAADNRLSFSDSGGLSVSFTPTGGSMENAGSGCGSARFVGSTKDPKNLKVFLDVDCRGGGYETKAKAELTGCGTFGL